MLQNDSDKLGDCREDTSPDSRISILASGSSSSVPRGATGKREPRIRTNALYGIIIQATAKNVNRPERQVVNGAWSGEGPVCLASHFFLVRLCGPQQY